MIQIPPLQLTTKHTHIVAQKQSYVFPNSCFFYWEKFIELYKIKPCLAQCVMQSAQTYKWFMTSADVRKFQSFQIPDVWSLDLSFLLHNSFNFSSEIFQMPALCSWYNHRISALNSEENLSGFQLSARQVDTLIYVLYFGWNWTFNHDCWWTLSSMNTDSLGKESVGNGAVILRGFVIFCTSRTQASRQTIARSTILYLSATFAIFPLIVSIWAKPILPGVIHLGAWMLEFWRKVVIHWFSRCCKLFTDFILFNVSLYISLSESWLKFWVDCCIVRVP